MAYVSISVEGGLSPSDLLDRIAAGDSNLPGQKAADFGLDGARRLTDEIQSAFSDSRSYWDAFQRRLERSHESRTTITREDWIAKFMELLGFEKLVVQRLSAEVGREKYFISHRAGDYPDASPVHVVGIDQELGHRDSTSRRSPHATVQEYLNRSDTLWGIVTNGRRLRLLRNIARLSKPTYLEFDLEGMIAGNLYSEFVLLYRLLHVSRFPRESISAHECLLERYYQQGIDEGGRVREKLRNGVEEALRTLGTAFLSHAGSERLRHRFQTGELDASVYYRQLLRVVYRFLFLMAAEERRLLFPTGEDGKRRQALYTKYYSISVLRNRADRYLTEDRHADLWLGLRETFRMLRDNEAASLFGLSALNGELFSSLACPDLEGAVCTNRELLSAIRELSTFRDEGGQRRRVNYAGLDVEEFGSVYESLLDFHPQVTIQPPSFDLVAGSERKQTGSYYTPPELVHELIESALVPVIEDRLRSLKTQEEREAALLGLRVCDPASGSGHFLLAAGRRIARELATVRSGEQEPSPEEYRHALRDVIRTCIYAVDKNPLAVDLCKVALWIEGHSAGLPLSFLDHHIKCGDSLVGLANLKVLDDGIPDEAYQPVTGDDKKAASYYKKRNQEEKKRERQLSLGEPKALAEMPETLAEEFQALATLEEHTPDDVLAKEGLYSSLRRQGTDWWRLKVACDLWTAAFFLPLQQENALHMEGVTTTGTLHKYLQTNAIYGPLLGQAVEASQNHPFFHWPLEFPDVFERGGFDVVLGNPPFMGGKTISGSLGSSYLLYLMATFQPARGVVDLCAYFFRQAFELLRTDGQLGMVATKTISQGDTRESGLAVILGRGGSITFAHRFIKWPGAANVEVNLVAVKRGHWREKHLLVDTMGVKPVDFISSRLDDEAEEEPQRLTQNDGKAFIGSVVLGTGFTLTPDKAQDLMLKTPQNRECIFPYLTGEDLYSRADQSPSRWIINFFDWPLSKAQRYPDLLNIVLEKVKPQRDNVNRDRYRTRWWQYAEICPGLYAATATLERVLVRAQTSETHALCFVPNGFVYAMMCVVFAFDDYYHFALLQSNIHEAWVRRNASTMRTDVRYTPTDCFDNFPFPEQPSEANEEWAERIGEAYHDHRRQVMAAHNLGLTKTYHLFHNPECHDPDIQRLRELHAEMDRSILACYGWQDIDPGHDFYKNERGQTRYSISPQTRREVLRRLLELNLHVASKEEGGK